MSKTRDIKSREDIELLVDSFYEKILKDETIGFIFNDVVKLDWDMHIPLMYDFWETTIFHKSSYRGNPLAVHLEINKRVRLEKKHFDQWLKIFNETIDCYFTGENAALAKTRALSIATVMQIKIYQVENRG